MGAAYEEAIRILQLDRTTPEAEVIATRIIEAARTGVRQQRYALRILADCPDGCTEALMMTRRVSVDAIIELFKAGLARADVTVGGKSVGLVRITEAGRCTLEDTEE